MDKSWNAVSRGVKGSGKLICVGAQNTPEGDFEKKNGAVVEALRAQKDAENGPEEERRSAVEHAEKVILDHVNAVSEAKRKARQNASKAQSRARSRTKRKATTEGGQETNADADARPGASSGSRAKKQKV
jgi:hypothetical protein